jgi:predicted restriction endonuclease
LSGEIDKQEFASIIETSRFKSLIEEYKKENGKEYSIEFYQQYKKILDKDERKLMAFYLGFNILNVEQFNKDVKQSQNYPEIFYDEDLRITILKEQNFKCKLCGKNINENNSNLHHIDYNKKNCETKNLVYLCFHCHGKTNSKRDFWKSVLPES